MAKKKGLPNDFVVRQLLLSLNEKLLSNPRSPSARRKCDATSLFSFECRILTCH